MYAGVDRGMCKPYACLKAAEIGLDDEMRAIGNGFGVESSRTNDAITTLTAIPASASQTSRSLTGRFWARLPSDGSISASPQTSRTPNPN
jgi:hypothetical protein